METLTESDLLVAWLSGDQEAFAVLVTRYQGLVHAACVRQAAVGDIDDCVQATFLVLARRAAAAARVPSLTAWLLRVATFVCRQSRRAAERRRRAESAAAQEAVPTGRRPVEALGHLDDCLLRLPEKQRTAVVMHFLAGESPEAVAIALGTSRENAYKLVNRGLAGLRSLFARRGMAMGSAALAGLLASEAQAAAAPVPVTLLVTLTTTATPSAGAAALATGAITAMTIALITPFALAAGLALAATTATIALSAEPASPRLTPGTEPEAASISTAPAPGVSPADLETMVQGEKTGRGLSKKELEEALVAAARIRDAAVPDSLTYWRARIQVCELQGMLKDTKSIDKVLLFDQANRSTPSDSLSAQIRDPRDDQRVRRVRDAESVELGQRYLALFLLPGITAKPGFRIDTIDLGGTACSILVPISAPRFIGRPHRLADGHSEWSIEAAAP